MFERVIDASRATCLAPMAELTVDVFAVEFRAAGKSISSWVGRPVAVLAICRRTLVVAGVHHTKGGVDYDDVLWCLADAFLPREAAQFGPTGFCLCEGIADRVFVHARHDLKAASVCRSRHALDVHV